jgi:hypothetical protein
MYLQGLTGASSFRAHKGNPSFVLLIGNGILGWINIFGFCAAFLWFT